MIGQNCDSDNLINDAFYLFRKKKQKTFDQETNSRAENETNTEVQKSAAVQLET